MLVNAGNVLGFACRLLSVIARRPEGGIGGVESSVGHKGNENLRPDDHKTLCGRHSGKEFPQPMSYCTWNDQRITMHMRLCELRMARQGCLFLL